MIRQKLSQFYIFIHIIIYQVLCRELLSSRPILKILVSCQFFCLVYFHASGVFNVLGSPQDWPVHAPSSMNHAFHHLYLFQSQPMNRAWSARVHVCQATHNLIWQYQKIWRSSYNRNLGTYFNIQHSIFCIAHTKTWLHSPFHIWCSLFKGCANFP